MLLEVTVVPSGKMSSFSLLHVPNVSASHSPRISCFQASAIPKYSAFPISVTKYHNLRATETGNARNGDGKGGGLVKEEDELPEGLKRELMPKHVAIFADGSRRWGKKLGLSANSGYEAATMTMIEVVKLCSRWGIPVISIFGSHIRNLGRPQEEIDFFIDMLEKAHNWALPFFQREGVRFSLIGDTSRFPKSLLNAKNEFEEATKHNSRTHFICPLNYTGSYDILQACKSISRKVKDGAIQMEDINEKLMGQELETRCAVDFPEPDLMIRTGGPQRLSDFYLWQLAYSELYFTEVLWPDFGKNDFVEALVSFQKRARGYGRQE